MRKGFYIAIKFAHDLIIPVHFERIPKECIKSWRYRSCPDTRKHLISQPLNNVDTGQLALTLISPTN